LDFPKVSNFLHKLNEFLDFDLLKVRVLRISGVNLKNFNGTNFDNSSEGPEGGFLEPLRSSIKPFEQSPRRDSQDANRELEMELEKGSFLSKEEEKIEDSGSSESSLGKKAILDKSIEEKPTARLNKFNTNTENAITEQQEAPKLENKYTKQLYKTQILEEQKDENIIETTEQTIQQTEEVKDSTFNAERLKKLAHAHDANRFNNLSSRDNKEERDFYPAAEALTPKLGGVVPPSLLAASHIAADASSTKEMSYKDFSVSVSSVHESEKTTGRLDVRDKLELVDIPYTPEQSSKSKEGMSSIEEVLHDSSRSQEKKKEKESSLDEFDAFDAQDFDESHVQPEKENESSKKEKVSMGEERSKEEEKKFISQSDTLTESEEIKKEIVQKKDASLTQIKIQVAEEVEPNTENVVTIVDEEVRAFKFKNQEQKKKEAEDIENNLFFLNQEGSSKSVGMKEKAGEANGDFQIKPLELKDSEEKEEEIEKKNSLSSFSNSDSKGSKEKGEEKDGKRVVYEGKDCVFN
jgi:hypothetical protein